MTTITDNFLKTYTDKTYKHTTLVSHKGILIGFALDDQRRIYYSVLNLSSTDPEKSPLDVNYWQQNPSELQFPTELGQVGYSIAPTTSMPIVKKGSRAEAKSGELRKEEIDPFLSTTARLTADAPFQALSDEKYIYLFRQSVNADHSDNVYIQTSSSRAAGADQQLNARLYQRNSTGNQIPVVQDTLLVDRFVLVGTELKLKQEVRYKRSRHKTRPLNSKDTLGAEDMENNPFFEPTHELDFVRYLTQGRFSVLLLPTQVADVQRWQIFTHNNNSRLIDSFNIERSKDGLFNTQGTIFYTSPDEQYKNAVFERQFGKCPFTGQDLIPILTKKGYAESTLRFNGSNNFVDLGQGVTVGSQFTLEAWIYSETDTNYHGFLGNRQSNTALSPCLWVYGRKIHFTFGYDQSTPPGVRTDQDVLTVRRWHHVACTFDGNNFLLYVDGQLQKLNVDNQFVGKTPGNTPIKYIGKLDNYFQGKIDEVRIWNYARSEFNIRQDMNFRLMGDEFGLLGYWRFDEGGGAQVFDQTANNRHGTISGTAEWITSDAPIGQRPGIQRTSFQFQGRTVESGLASLLYYQQEQAKTGYDQTAKPMKQSARVLLAGATKSSTEPSNYIGVLDFAVSRDGFLAQIPDNINLRDKLEDNTNEILKQIQGLEERETQLQELIQQLIRDLQLQMMPLEQLIRQLEQELMEVEQELREIPTNPLLVTYIQLIQRKQFLQPNLNNCIELCRVETELYKLKQLLNQKPISLSFLYLDPMGLTVSGGLLGFAPTKDTPQLFDSATGQLALYFRGANDEFLAAYYDTNTVKAEYQLPATTGKLTLLARSAIGEMNRTQITVAGLSSAENCTVTITNIVIGITETWRQVPREVNKFVNVLNGQDQDYNYEQQASTNKPAYVLQNGSLYFIAFPNQASGNIQDITVDQPYSSALSCNWIADSPGKALSFVGNDYISVTTPEQLAQFDAKGDVTLEAWVKPSTVSDEAQVIYHFSNNCKYALSLKNQNSTSYIVKAGVDNRLLQTVGTISKANWNHLAVVFNQSYALQFDSTNYLDAGKDSTLNTTEDLTIEVVLKLDDTNSRGILSKGVLNSGLAQEYVPYALSLKNGKLVFTFENDQGQQQKIESTTPLNTNQVYKIAITRQKHLESATSSDPTYGGLVSLDVGNFDDINNATDLNNKSADVEKVIKADFVASKKRGKQLESSSNNVPNRPTSGLPTGTQITQWIEVKIYIDGRLDSNKALPTATCGRNSQPLEIGKVGNSYFKGSIAEVRFWNRALPQGEINQNVVGAEEGLLAWWRLEENEGNIAYDSKSNNHAQIKGATWIKNPDPNGSSLVIYVNGISMATQSINDIPWQTKQFTLGALKSNSSFTKYLSGTLEEVRIWKVARTQEQIQDNLFTRLKGEKENLIANYTFDGEDTDPQILDSSLLSNHLPWSDGNSRPNFILSTAPISNDIAQVCSALAEIATQFHDTINSRPAVQEYSDSQYDIDGNLIAVMKRCYTFIKNNQWHLVTGYKVGNLITEWISQAQFDPQIIGFIEGAPPVPSENLTVGPSGNYGGVTSLEVVEAENVMYTFSNSKEEGSDQALEVEGKVGASFDTRVLVAPFGFGISFKLKGDFKAGTAYESQSSKGWSSDQSFSFGRNVSKNTFVSLNGSWENPNQILNQDLGKRYVPNNMGFALVQSETADVFALRLAHNNALVSFRFQPNPDIPKDVNLIPFKINPRYTKQGTLDGAVGYNSQGKVQDLDYPNATGYGEYSYFKPKEAYALKKRIKQEEEELKVYYRNFDTGVNNAVLSEAYQPGSDFSKQLENKFGLSIGNTSSSNSVPQEGSLSEKYAKRNLVNTYVWTADGGFYAESTEVTEVKQETIAGTFSSSNSFGGGFDVSIESPVIFETSFSAMNGGHLNVTKSKTQEAQNSFRLDVTVNTPGDLQQYDEQGNPVYESGNPKIVEGKVDAYRFMTFYLEPVKENFEDLFNKVVDPIWLNQSNHPNALAMLQAKQAEKTPPCWRVFHRVTFVSRILPELPSPTAPPLEEAMHAAHIESNWQLIQKLEPLVRHKTNNFAEFSAAVGKAVDTYLPELRPYKPEVIRYMALYFGIDEVIS